MSGAGWSNSPPAIGDAGQAIASLVLREVPRWSPRQVRSWLASVAGALHDRDRALVDAAMAMRSGRLGDVAAALAGVADRSLPATLRVAAELLARNRFPGGVGALFEDGDVAALPDPPSPTDEDPAEAHLMLAAGQVEPMVATWRTLARDGTAETRQLVITRAQQLRAIAQGGAPWLAAYLALVEADLHRRGGDGTAAVAAWSVAAGEFGSAGDALGVAACHVAWGDWHAATRSSPEVLDLVIDASPAPSLGERDPATARQAYQAAHSVYEAFGCELGLAALRLREGYLAAVEGDDHGWASAAGDAETLASAADDEWLALLAAVHHALATISAGQSVDGARLAAWAGRLEAARARSWVRGLVRLTVAASARLREAGEFVPARRVLRLARAMADASRAPREAVDVTDGLLQLYGRMSFPAPRAVLDLAGVRRQLATVDADSDPVGWYQLAQRAVSAMSLATQVADGELVTSAGRLVEAVAAAGPAEADPMSTMLTDALRSSAAQARVLGPLYAARAARRDGYPERAEPLEREALAATDTLTGVDRDFLRAVVLGTVGRKDEALAVVEQIRTQLPTDHLRALYVRLDAPDRALGLLPPVDPPSERPWEALAHRALIYAGLERWTDAAAAADAGIEAFETALGRYVRDALKTSATEDLDAADLYLARILADAPAALAGDRSALARSFATSDRARSISNVERVGDERSEPAVRRWLACGSRWAATYESLSAHGGAVDSLDVDAARQQLRRVEDELDDAEDDLWAEHPPLVELMHGRRPSLDVDAVAAALPEGALLIQYHCWNDELLSWALTSSDLALSHRHVDGKVLASDGRRFLRAAAGRAPWDAVLADRLGELLLGPWADLLADHERVVVVPHGALTGVPLHLLPTNGALLGDEHVVSYAPSASHLPHLHVGTAPGPEGRMLLVGDPAYASDVRLPRLPGSGVEVRTVAASWPSAEVLTGADATRDAVLALGPGAGIIHFGTHGRLDERAPNRSHLALAGHDVLTPADLFALDLDGAMVVLSACNSGRGTATAGGDVIGLSRAVLGSGAGSVVASLWPVGDVAGCLLMARWYERLAGSEGRPGEEAAVALHHAAAAVRAMSPGDRRAEYAALADRAGLPDDPADVRDAGAAAASSPPAGASDTAAWAPFVYVGR